MDRQEQTLQHGRTTSIPADYNQQVVEAFRANGGAVPGLGNLLLLTTTGAKSGQPRIAPLRYSRDGNRLVIAAFKGGAPSNPDWYRNLSAHPHVTVEVGNERYRARAHAADGANEQERARLFAQHADLMPDFKDYAAKTTRKIPMIALERLG